MEWEVDAEIEDHHLEEGEHTILTTDDMNVANEVTTQGIAIGTEAPAEGNLTLFISHHPTFHDLEK